MSSRHGRAASKDETVKAFDSLVTGLRRLVNGVPEDTKLLLLGSTPGGTPGTQPLPDETTRLIKDRVLPALQALEATLPLERSVDEGIWETLSLQVNGWSGNAWISVSNAIGEREHVTTFGTDRAFGPYISAWGRSRRENEDLGTSWDLARRERRVVLYDGKPTLIDQGANRVVDILAELGRETMGSCEGHPSGAYVHFKPAVDGRLGTTFGANGWSVDPCGTFVRMREVTTTEERDAIWRRTCAALELRYGLEGPEETTPGLR